MTDKSTATSLPSIHLAALEPDTSRTTRPFTFHLTFLASQATILTTMTTLRKNRQSAFTLVEIMIVVLIIGLLAAFAVPNFRKSRSLAQKNGCIDNMRLIHDAVTEVLFDGEVPSAATIYGPDNLIKFKPKCPANKDGPDYEIPTDDETLPVCPNADAFPEHKLPVE